MSKSKARFLAELLGADGTVKEDKSALDISGGKITLSEIPEIPNSQLAHSSITLNGDEVSLGGSHNLDLQDIVDISNISNTHIKLQDNAWYWTQFSDETDQVRFNANNLGGLDIYNQTQTEFAQVRLGSIRFSSAGEFINSAKVTNWDTAYGWGDHSTEGYLTESTLAAGVGNITTSGYLRGPATFTIDPAAHGDDTGKVVIAGDLQVDGTTTTINSTTVAIDDKNLVLAENAADASEANGAGITINGADASIAYNSTQDLFDFNKDIRLNVENANMWIKSGTAGTNGFINWTFDREDTVYNKVGMDYDTRATTGFHIDAGYPITIDAVASNDKAINFAIQGNVKAFFDGSGNFLVGTTNADNSDAGFEARSDGRMFSTSTTASGFNLLADGGDLVSFYRNSAIKGSIGVAYSEDLYLAASVSHAKGILFNSNGLIPFDASTKLASNNAMDIGQASNKFKDLYLAGNANINSASVAGNLTVSGVINGTKTKAKSVSSLSTGTYYYLCSTLSSYNGDSSSANVTIYATGANHVVEASIVVKNAGGVSFPAVHVKSTTITGLSIVAEKQSGSDDIIHFYVKTTSNIAYTPRIVVTDLINGEFQSTEPSLSTEEYVWSCDSVNSANIKVSGNVHVNDNNIGNAYLRLNKGASGDGGILFETDNTLKWQNVQGADTLNWYSYAVADNVLTVTDQGNMEIRGGQFGKNISDSFTLNGKTQPHYGLNLDPGQSGVPIGLSGYYGISFATNGSKKIDIERSGATRIYTALGVGSAAPEAQFHVNYMDGSSTNRTSPVTTMIIETDNNNAPYTGFGGTLLFKNRAYNSGISESAAITAVINNDSTQVRGGSLLLQTSTTVDASPTTKMSINWEGTVYCGGTNFDAQGAGESVQGIYKFSNGRLGVTNSSYSWFSRLNDGEVIRFCRSTTAAVGSISLTSSGTTYNTTSDRRLKENIELITDGKEKLLSMKPVTHTWKSDQDAIAVHGFIAQEMKKVMPEAVSGDENSDEMMSMDYGRITPVIVAALQDALKEIEDLRTRINELEDK